MCSLVLRAPQRRDFVIDVSLSVRTLLNEFDHFVYEWVCTVGNFIHH